MLHAPSVGRAATLLSLTWSDLTGSLAAQLFVRSLMDWVLCGSVKTGESHGSDFYQILGRGAAHSLTTLLDEITMCGERGVHQDPKRVAVLQK